MFSPGATTPRISVGLARVKRTVNSTGCGASLHSVTDIGDRRPTVAASINNTPTEHPDCKWAIHITDAYRRLASSKSTGWTIRMPFVNDSFITSEGLLPQFSGFAARVRPAALFH